MGLYRGIKTMGVGWEGGTLEVAVVEYEGGDRLNVPLYRLDQLEPYSAAGNGDAPPPKLHRLGATVWQRQREKTRAALPPMGARPPAPFPRPPGAGRVSVPPPPPRQRPPAAPLPFANTPH